ncbi:MAG: OmpA family protein, partial [Bacteroidales bacterium]
YDIPLSSASSRTQVELSPFVSFHPYFGHAPRTIESWSLQTVRAGLALKFGRTRAPKVVAAAPVVVPVVVVVEPDADFNINAPAKIQVKRVIKESFPIRNSVFFSENSSAIPGRYIQLTSQQASAFEENKSQEARPENFDGRSKRQLTAYYNVLNILGDRMRANPMANVTLVGSSAGKGAAKGKEYAESVKSYLVNVYGISPARITTEGRNLPVHPSQQPGATIDLVMLGDDDRRVDIVSSSSALLVPIQFSTVHQDEGMVVFNTKAKEETNIKSWTVDVIDQEKKVQHFGPFTGDVASIRGNDILGDRPEGTYKVIMNAQTEDGKLIRKESTLSLVQGNVVEQNEHRFSILFDFDKSKTVASYEKFLNEVVSPQIMDNASVMIQGHSDTIGSEKYNLVLSQQRAKDAQTILEKALVKAGTKGVTFQSVGKGDNTNSAPFSNNLPEGRFYNRTVIIDIVLAK